MPLELNFFKHAQTNLGKRKMSDTTDHREGKRRSEEDKDVDVDMDERPLIQPLTTHRVSTKGTNIPQHIDSFEVLKKTYELPSHLFSNVSNSGYCKPTSIQAYCVPILLSVSIPKAY